jgi:cytochrome c2
MHILKPALALLAMFIAGPALAEPDPDAGKTVFKKCRACHTVKAGKNKVGPTLYKIVGAPSAAVPDFRYSSALSEAGLIWDKDTLAAFLAEPKKIVPGNKMSFPGLKTEADIENLIAYILDESQ